MTPCNRLAIVALLMVVFLASFATAADATPPKLISMDQARANRRRPRSILQACRSELPTLCKDRRDAMKCLTSQVSQVQDETCKTWLVARETCNKWLTSNKKCSEKENPRVCLRQVAKDELPADCAESDYYKSVKLFGMYRRRHTANTKPPISDNQSA